MNPYLRFALSIAAVAVLVEGAGEHPHNLRIFIASWMCALVLLYVAGGGRLPWKVRIKDYLIYILVSLALVGIVIVFALYGPHTAR